MGMFWTCEETVAALSDYEEGILPFGAFLSARTHLFNCPECRALLATLRALPALAAHGLAPEPDAGDRARRALDGALARLGRPEEPRPWPATPVPMEACRVLEGDPDLPMQLLAATHDHLARQRVPAASPCPLPQDTLDHLPPADRWIWKEERCGARRAELLPAPPDRPRLVLMYAPPSAVVPPHQHLGSESILVLDGSMDDQGRDYRRGDWVHHPEGSCHSPHFALTGCWCLVREEGVVRFLGNAG